MGTETPPPAGDPDRDLVKAAQAGASEAFDRLVVRHQDRVVRLARRITGDAETALDVAQTVFVRAWRGLSRFHGDSRFSTWLTRIAINQCRNELRRRRTLKHTRPASLDETSPFTGTSRAANVADPGPTLEEHAEARELGRALEDALRDLEPEAREILVLREVEALSYEDMAALLDVAVGTVRSRLHRARAALRTALDGQGVPSPARAR
ncbi:MAG: RNA polymerase sigma factor [Planctomycetota bacterium]